MALALAGSEDRLSLCFIRRAEAPGDRWSGQMAFPGGRSEPHDRRATVTAMRETREEVGLELAEEQLLGGLSEVDVHHRGKELGMVLSGFVFYLGAELRPLTPNEEVAEAYWIDVDHLWNPANVTSLEWRREPAAPLATFPGIRYRDQIIWGLTFRILTTLAEVLDRPLPRLATTAP